MKKFTVKKTAILLGALGLVLIAVACILRYTDSERSFLRRTTFSGVDCTAYSETGATAQQYHFLTDACLALKNYELQAIVCDTQLAINLCASNEGLKCFELVYADGSKTDEQYGVAMKKGDAEFVAKVNEILAPIVEDGTIDGWIVKHSELSSNLK